MQPYLFPYLGYFQLINAVDEFVVYDNVQFVKQGWVNRNRLLLGGKPEYFTLPLKKDSDYLDVVDRQLADSFPDARNKILRRIAESYRKAPYFSDVYALVERCMSCEDASNLFEFLYFSLEQTLSYLKLNKSLRVSSDLEQDPPLKGEQRVLNLCKLLGATTYINAPGGWDLYDPENFSRDGIALRFIKPRLRPYPQSGSQEFVPGLSIIDVMMWNSPDEVRGSLDDYAILEKSPSG